MKWFQNFRIAILHAKFHRNMKKANLARQQQDILKFKKYIYRAEDAWRRLVIIKESMK